MNRNIQLSCNAPRYTRQQKSSFITLYAVVVVSERCGGDNNDCVDRRNMEQKHGKKCFGRTRSVVGRLELCCENPNGELAKKSFRGFVTRLDVVDDEHVTH